RSSTSSTLPAGRLPRPDAGQGTPAIARESRRGLPPDHAARQERDQLIRPDVQAALATVARRGANRDIRRRWAGSVPGVKRDFFWLRDWRVLALAGGCLVAGFLAGLLIFGSPWHLPPNFGDIPTWLLVVLGAIGGWAALRQLRILQEQVRDE